MISVITPYYNAKDTIWHTLASLEGQTYRDFELVLVLDGEQLLSFAHKWNFPIRVYTIPHGGPARARNIGIANSNGDYILPLDADDLLVPTFLEELSKFRQDIIYCNYILFGSEHQIVNSGNYVPKKLYSGNYLVNSTLFKKSVWERLKQKNGTGYDEEIPAWEDWLFWLEAELLGCTFQYVPEWLFLYRKSTHSRDHLGLAQRGQIRSFANAKIKRLYQTSIEI